MTGGNFAARFAFSVTFHVFKITLRQSVQNNWVNFMVSINSAAFFRFADTFCSNFKVGFITLKNRRVEQKVATVLSPFVRMRCFLGVVH